MDANKLMATAKKEDIHKLLEILMTTEDSDVLVKVFSVLAISLVSNDDFKYDIVTCNVIYNKIRGVLTQKLPSKIAITLNFISAMLYIEEEGPTRKKSLVLYAQNMLRNSGCLLAMCYLFTSPIMHQDTWCALCRCIAESCQNSQENQNFCSALVPQCVKKVTRGVLEVISTLKSLLNNSPVNMQIFLECNGLNIFNRKLLHDDDCLQLLDILVQNIPMESLQLLYNQVFEDLQYFKTVHQTHTRVGQWLTVILHHFSTKGIKNRDKSCVEEQKMIINNNQYSETGYTKPPYDDTAKLHHFSTKGMKNSDKSCVEGQKMLINHNQYSEAGYIKPQYYDTAKLYNFSIKGIKNRDKSCVEEQNMLINNNQYSETGYIKPQCDDTAKLVQNVMREIYHFNVPGALKKPATDNVKRNTYNGTRTAISSTKRPFVQNSFVPHKIIIDNTLKSTPIVSQKDSDNDLSFGFLLEQPVQDSRVNVHDSRKNGTAFIKQRANQFTKKDIPDGKLDYNSYFNSTRNSTKYTNNHCNNDKTFDFKPIFVSTPKHRQGPDTFVNSTKCSRLSRYSLRTLKKHKHRNEECKMNKKYHKETENSQVDSIRHRSMSTRLFDAINESCTTLVKTVKNIFKQKKSTNTVTEKEIASTGKVAKADDSCSYSFTEYMRKRDAELTREVTKSTSAVSEVRKVDSCKTCNDTLQLKRKIMSDDYLRQTVKKLKLGINVYGCDFKKISKAMWPRETYMTPDVLYNLYRKVILK